MASNSTSCWYPDGTSRGDSTGPVFVPCVPSAVHSACCALGESCTGNGLCYSDDGGIYRGGCTDSTWKHPACSKYCVSASAGPNSGSQTAFQFLNQCGTLYPPVWSCPPNDCTTNFTLLVGSIQQLNITGVVSSLSSTTSATSTPTSTTSTPTSSTPNTSHLPSAALTSSNPSCSSTPSSTIVGLGVGVPLGIIALLSIAWALWERRQLNQRISNAEAAQGLPPSQARSAAPKGPVHEMPAGRESGLSATPTTNKAETRTYR